MRLSFLFLTFVFVSFTLAIDPLKINDVSLSDFQSSSTNLIERSNDNYKVYPYEWYTIDGQMNDLPDKNNFQTAFWVFNFSFLHSLRLQTSPTKAQKILFQATIEYNIILRNECWKITNESVAESKPPRRFTLARVASFPSEDSNDEIDPIYNLVAAVKVTCFERKRNGDPNKPVKFHTKQLIQTLNWDRQSALRKLKKIHKHFPIPTKSTKKNFK